MNQTFEAVSLARLDGTRAASSAFKSVARVHQDVPWTPLADIFCA